MQLGTARVQGGRCRYVYAARTLRGAVTQPTCRRCSGGSSQYRWMGYGKGVQWGSGCSTDTAGCSGDTAGMQWGPGSRRGCCSGEHWDAGGPSGSGHPEEALGGAVGPWFSSVRRFGRESASGDAVQHTVSAVGNAVWCRGEASGHSREQRACCEGRSRDAVGTTQMLWGWGLGAAGWRGCSGDAVWVKWVHNKVQKGRSSTQWG